jgi:hypothetical protein
LAGRCVDPADANKAARIAKADPNIVAEVTAEFIDRYANPMDRNQKSRAAAIRQRQKYPSSR